jgi:DNA-binding MarR family transcriptional regulator
VQANKSRTLAADLQWLFIEFQRRGGTGVLSLIDESGLSTTQMKALMVIEAAPSPLSVGALADALGLSTAAASRAAEALFRQQLLERGVCENDHRARELVLSKGGRDFARDLARTRERDLAAFVSALDGPEVEALAEALHALRTAQGSSS